MTREHVSMAWPDIQRRTRQTARHADCCLQLPAARPRDLCLPCMDDHRASCVATSSAVATHRWRQRRVRSPVHEYAEASKLSTSSLRNAATSTFSEPAWLPNGNLRGTAPGVSTTAAAYSALVKAKPATQGARHQRARLRSRRLQRRACVLLCTAKNKPP